MNTIATTAAAVRLTSAEEIQARVNELVANCDWESKSDFQYVKEQYTDPRFIAEQKVQIKASGAVLSRLVDIKDESFDDKIMDAYFTEDFVKQTLAVIHLMKTGEVTFAGYLAWMNYTQGQVAKDTGLLSQVEYIDLLTNTMVLEGCLSKAYAKVSASEELQVAFSISNPQVLFEVLNEDFVREAVPEAPKAVQDKVIAYLNGLNFAS